MITIFSTRNSWMTKLLGYTTIFTIIHTDRQNSLLTDLQYCTTMLTIIHTWNSLLTKLPGEHQPSLPAQRAQVLPQQSKKQSNYIRNISKILGRFYFLLFNLHFGFRSMLQQSLQAQASSHRTTTNYFAK